MYTTCSELGIFMYWSCNSMNNLVSYYGLVDARIRTSDKHLPVLLFSSFLSQFIFFKNFGKPSTYSQFFLIFQVSLVLGANIQTMQVLLNLERRTLHILKTTCQRWKNDPRKLKKKHPWKKNQHFTSKMLTIIKVCIVFLCVFTGSWVCWNHPLGIPGAADLCF